MKIIVLDTETTGLSVKEGHRIVEIGCIELDNLIPTSKVFHCYLNPERKVSEKALEVHGYTDEFLSDKKKFIDIADEFISFIDGKKIVIHNAEFDISHLNNELGIIGKKKINKENIIDTLDIARDKFPGSQISLDALCRRYRIDNSKRIKHTALIDCELLTKVYINLIDQKEPSLNFTNENQNINNIKYGSKNNYSKKIIKPSVEETNLHKNFLKNSLTKNFF
jgi:DNA polymerase III, epsilon subunit, Proteobacterial